MAQRNRVADMMEDWFKKLPPLPRSITDFIVTITPWLALVFGILGVIGSLVAFGVFTFFSPLVALGSGIGSATGGIVASVLSLASSVLLLAAFTGTREKKLSGWTFLFWSMIAGVLANVATISIGGVIFSLIGFYILFQIKHYYK